jgi:2-iminobutanoate/2-iminopropanoate deaminase
MKMQTIHSPKVPDAPPKTWSNMKVFDRHFHVAGMTSRGTPAESMYEQARATFQKIKDMVEAAGGTMDDIMTMTVFVTDLPENVEVWRAREEFFTGDFPCSTLVQVSAVGVPGATPRPRVEIQCSGYLGSAS